MNLFPPVYQLIQIQLVTIHCQLINYLTSIHPHPRPIDIPTPHLVMRVKIDYPKYLD